MKTQFAQEEDIVVVHLQGLVHYEAQKKLQESLSELQKKETPPRVIFNLKDLEFVGSSHILPFIQLLKEFNQNCLEKPKYCFVQREFQKIMKAFDEESDFKFYESLEQAKKEFRYSHPPSKCS